MGELHLLKDQNAFEQFIASDNLTVIHFAANWSHLSRQMEIVTSTLAEEFKDVHFAVIEAEELSEVSLQYKITATPTAILFRRGKEVNRVKGFTPKELRSKILAHCFDQVEPKDSNDRLKKLINQAPLMLFMKGTLQNPQCKFTRRILELLNSVHAQFSTFDIFSDNEVREGLKEYSNWPTYPQLYLNGELIGGVDVVAEELKNPEFVEKLPKINVS